MWDMIRGGYGHIALGPTDFLSGRPHPSDPSQDEYSISSIYTAGPVVWWCWLGNIQQNKQQLDCHTGERRLHSSVLLQTKASQQSPSASQKCDLRSHLITTEQAACGYQTCRICQNLWECVSGEQIICFFSCHFPGSTGLLAVAWVHGQPQVASGAPWSNSGWC